jgi:hypothetical protein
MPDEPLHETAGEAMEWVNDNTDNYIYGFGHEVKVRVDAGGSVLLLTQSPSDGLWFWMPLRRWN